MIQRATTLLMSSLSHNRIVSAIRGAFIADAASLGTHWIYDPEKMKAAVPSVEAPEFKDPPDPSYYSATEFPGHYGSGMLSPYGEQLLFMTEFAASELDIDGSKMSDAMLEWAETFGGRPDHATTEFVKNKKEGKSYLECGADDDQAHCFVKVVPVTCLYAGKPELAAKVEEAIRVHQNNDVAVAFGLASSCVLEAILLGSSLEDALSKCSGVGGPGVIEAFATGKDAAEKESLEEMLIRLSNEKMKDQKESPFYNLAARSCALPSSFIVPLHQFYAVGSEPNAYVTAVRNNILGAGDTCGRAVILGAILAAATDGPPDDWLGKMDTASLARINFAAEKIAAHAVATCPAS